jgi:hypothetical protein
MIHGRMRRMSRGRTIDHLVVSLGNETRSVYRPLPGLDLKANTRFRNRVSAIVSLPAIPQDPGYV